MISLNTTVLSASARERTGAAARQRKGRRGDERRNFKGTGICSRFRRKLQAAVSLSGGISTAARFPSLERRSPNQRWLQRPARLHAGPMPALRAGSFYAPFL